MTSRYSLNSWKGDANNIFLCQEISLTMFDMGKFLLVHLVHKSEARLA